MNLLVFLLLGFFVQDPPYKAKSEFSVRVDYHFKARPHSEVTPVFQVDKPQAKGTVLPYLILKVSVDSLKNSETRVRITNNKTSLASTKKITTGTILSVDVGFTEDAKDGVTASRYTLTFMNQKKEAVNRIVLTIDADGNFFVNEEKRGKF